MPVDVHDQDGPVESGVGLGLASLSLVVAFNAARSVARIWYDAERFSMLTWKEQTVVVTVFLVATGFNLAIADALVSEVFD